MLLQKRWKTFRKGWGTLVNESNIFDIYTKCKGHFQRYNRESWRALLVSTFAQTSEWWQSQQTLGKASFYMYTTVIHDDIYAWHLGWSRGSANHTTFPLPFANTCPSPYPPPPTQHTDPLVTSGHPLLKEEPLLAAQSHKAPSYMQAKALPHQTPSSWNVSNK